MTAVLLLAMVAPSLALSTIWKDKDDFQGASRGTSTYLLENSARTVTVSASAAATWNDAVVVRAPAWSGLITQVFVASGTSVENGSAIARLGGVEIRFFAIASPLYEPACLGSVAQVGEIRALLTTAGLQVGSSARLSTLDVTGIRKYAAAIGVPGSADLTCFDPSWVVTGPVDVGAVASVGLTVGMPAPAAGEPVLVGRSTLAALALRGDTGASMIDDHLTVEGATTFAATELLINGQPTSVGLTELSSPEVLASLGSSLRPAAPTAKDPATAEQAESDAETKVAVMLTLSDSQFVVPATAVVMPFDSQACIVPHSDGGPSIPVTVIASSIGGLIIDVGPETIPGPIRVSPGDVSCA